MFEHLDKNRDGYIHYQEFCNLCDEKRRNIDPFEAPAAKDPELEQLERMSMASQMYQGFKSRKMKNKLQLSKQIGHQTFGVSSLPSDNMNKIITHQFEKEFNQRMQTRIDKEKEVTNDLDIKRSLRGAQTKTSKIRHEFQL